MAKKWAVRGRPSWDVQEIVLDHRSTIRVRANRYLVGYVYSLPELEQLLKRNGLGLDDLVEQVDPTT